MKADKLETSFFVDWTPDKNKHNIVRKKLLHFTYRENSDTNAYTPYNVCILCIFRKEWGL